MSKPKLSNLGDVRKRNRVIYKAFDVDDSHKEELDSENNAIIPLPDHWLAGYVEEEVTDDDLYLSSKPK